MHHFKNRQKSQILQINFLGFFVLIWKAERCMDLTSTALASIYEQL